MLSKTLYKLLYSVLLSIAVVGLIVVLAPYFKIKVIETNANKKDMDGFPPLGGKYIFELSSSDIQKYFTKNPVIKKAVVTKKLPNIIKVEVEYRSRLVEIMAKNGSFAADSDGYIFERIASNSALPKIRMLTKEVDLGTNITQSNLNIILDIVRNAQIKNIQISDIIPLEQDEIIIVLSSGTQVIIGSNAKAEEIVSSLQMILRRFTIEGKTIAKIDFRFDKPYITY